MKSYKSFFCLFFISVLCLQLSFGQKPLIDKDAYKDWEYSLGTSPQISNNGEYIYYDVKDRNGSKMIVVTSKPGWKLEILGYSRNSGKITNDSKYLFFMKGSDSLGRITLGKSSLRYISNVSSFNIIQNGAENWILYRYTIPSAEITLENLKTGKRLSYTGVLDVIPNKSGQVAILKNDIGRTGNIEKEIIWLNLNNGKSISIWRGTNASNIVFDPQENQIAFIADSSIQHYKEGMRQSVCLVKAESIEADNGLKLGSLSKFSRDGKRLFIQLKGDKRADIKSTGVEIWSYIDTNVRSLQESETKHERNYLAVVNIKNGKVIQLEHECENVSFPEFEESPDTVLIIKHYAGNPYSDEGLWNLTCQSSIALISTKNGKQKKLKINEYMSLTPKGKYFVYFDKKQQNYFSYEIATGLIRNITSGISTSWILMNLDDNIVIVDRPARGIAGWLKNDKAVLIYDRNDIWRIDPSGSEKPINLTNGYGLKHNTVFNLGMQNDSHKELLSNEQLVLNAFNLSTKDNGFFLKQLDKIGDPELLHMGPYLYDTNSKYVPYGSNFPPIKAEDTEMYIVRRMSVNDAPNYFSTKDFKTFNRLTDFQPQKKYNWYATELHGWKSLDGRELQGVLYKPENFDPDKKYPVIFHYYERKSDGLNAYIKPEPLPACDGCTINIPSLVSQGYLVFCPDIYYKIGDPMQGTYDAVVSAARYISNLGFVNTSKMGIQGCSFGGLQTDYLVTHTNLFAAAVSSSGVADLVRGYGSLFSNGHSQQGFYEGGQIRMGESLWMNPSAYINNSSIFQVDKVTTPLLIMHTKNDGGCLYTDAVAFFTGLRRLGKKAWLLTYVNENHGLMNLENVNDFSIRMMQFFDHYLKDKPAPIWMTRGNSVFGAEGYSGLEYDKEIRTPGPGILTPKEQQKVDSLMTRGPITIRLR